MPNAPQGMHLCPTRADGEQTLFAHMITPSTCQQRQREHYHKCPNCVHANARQVAAPAAAAAGRAAERLPRAPRLAAS